MALQYRRDKKIAAGMDLAAIVFTVLNPTKLH